MKEEALSLEIDVNGVRSSVRFPIHLPVQIIAEDRHVAGTTENISASGVLFRLEENIAVNVPVEFLLEIPSGNLPGEHTGALHCLGRVVRSYQGNSSSYAAAVIEEYSFQ